MTTDISSSLAERAEIEAYTDFVAGTPAATRDLLGVARFNVGGGLVTTVRGDSTRFWTKAGGLGFVEPVTVDLVTQVCDFFHAQGLPRGTFLLAPSVLPADWPEICAKLDIIEGGRYVKLVCHVDSLLDRSTLLDPALRVGPVNVAHAHEWSSVMMRTFGFLDDGMVEVGASMIGRPDWHPFAVWDGDEIVATAATHVYEDSAHIFGAATVPQARGRGAQSALLHARALAAKAAGCQWLVAETGAEQPQQHSTSLHNMLRAGFRPLYERANWVWQTKSH